MPYFAVAENLATHPKVLEAGTPAMGLWVRAGSWSVANLTDGFIPTRIAIQLGSRSMCYSLVCSGLWDEHPKGFVFHDWADLQLTKSEVEARRKYDRERKRNQRKSNIVPIGVPPGQATEQPSDVPRGLPPESDRSPRGVTGPRVTSTISASYLSSNAAVGSAPAAAAPNGAAAPPKTCPQHPYGNLECQPCHRAERRHQNWFSELQASLKHTQDTHDRTEPPNPLDPEIAHHLHAAIAEIPGDDPWAK